jgi:hypothetical protein
MFIFTLLLGYVSLFVFVQQDVHNAIGLPSFVVDHVVAQVVSDGIDETKQFLEKNVYDSRDFNVV